MLVVGADFSTKDMEAVYVADDFRELPRDRLAETLRLAEVWAGDKRPQRRTFENDPDYLVRLGNEMLHDPRLGDRVPQTLRLRAQRDEEMLAAAQSALAGIERHREVQSRTFAPYLMIEHCNRRLMEAYFPAIRKLPPKVHWANLYPWDGTSTRQIAASWSGPRAGSSGAVCAEYGFPQSPSPSAATRFCLDRTDPDVDDVLRRRGITGSTEPRLLAFDLPSGRVLWTRRENIVGYEMFYSAAHDVPVQAMRPRSSPQDWWSKPRDLSVRFIAYRGADGRVLWDRTVTQNRPGGGHRLWYNWLLHDDTIILESYRDVDAEFYGFDLLTGARSIGSVR